MRKLLLPVVALIALLASHATLADVQVRLRMNFPAVLPPLVEVQPGVRVVQDFDEEVFFVDGSYFVQRDGNWYRTRDHRGTWRYVRQASLPPALLRQEPGRYRHWKHDERKSRPAVQQARHDARHWQANDDQERHEAQEHRDGSNRGEDRGGHGGDRHEDRREGEHHEGERR
jgi:hypothetical protein